MPKEKMKEIPRDMVATAELKESLHSRFNIALGQMDGAISVAYLRGEADGIAMAAHYLARSGDIGAATRLRKRFGP